MKVTNTTLTYKHSYTYLPTHVSKMLHTSEEWAQTAFRIRNRYTYLSPDDVIHQRSRHTSILDTGVRLRPTKPVVTNTYVHTYIRTYVGTHKCAHVQKVDQNTAPNGTGVNVFIETTNTANATNIGNVFACKCALWNGKSFQEENKHVCNSTVSVYLVQWKWLIAHFGHCILRHSTQRPGNMCCRYGCMYVSMYVCTRSRETQFGILLLAQVLIWLITHVCNLLHYVNRQ